MDHRTPVIRNLLQNEPASLSPNSPEETREQGPGL